MEDESKGTPVRVEPNAVPLWSWADVTALLTGAPLITAPAPVRVEPEVLPETIPSAPISPPEPDLKPLNPDILCPEQKGDVVRIIRREFEDD